MDFPREYWREKTMHKIAGAIGTPLIIDSTNQYCDLNSHVFYEIMVERYGFAFEVEVVLFIFN
jgi:hypothetical protein